VLLGFEFYELQDLIFRDCTLSKFLTTNRVIRNVFTRKDQEMAIMFFKWAFSSLGLVD